MLLEKKKGFIVLIFSRDICIILKLIWWILLCFCIFFIIYSGVELILKNILVSGYVNMKEFIFKFQEIGEIKSMLFSILSDSLYLERILIRVVVVNLSFDCFLFLLLILVFVFFLYVNLQVFLILYLNLFFFGCGMIYVSGNYM